MNLVDNPDPDQDLSISIFINIPKLSFPDLLTRSLDVSESQRFRGQVGPILELLKCYFFPLEIIFIDSYVTTTTYV